MISVADIAPCCAWVMQRARQVSIRCEQIPAYARFLLDLRPPAPGLDPALHHVTADREETAAYVLALDSVNFGSGCFRLARDCGLELEYAVIARGLKAAFIRGELNTPQQWRQVTAADFSRLLALPSGRHPDLDRLLERFALHLRLTGENLAADHQGRVLPLLAAAGHSAPRLAEIVAAWPHFRDAHLYDGREIPLLKRAQILAADMHLALGGFSGMERLTIFADNMVPHVLRCDGVLEYAPALAEKIEAGVQLISGSAEEVEIRAAAIHAVELLKREVLAAGRALTAVNLDHLLWHRGYEPAIYARLSHRTLTGDY